MIRKKDSIIGTKIGTTQLRVSGVSLHVTERINERDLDIEKVKSALSSPIYVRDVKYAENGASQKYIGKYVTVAINTETGNLITAYKTSSRILRKWERENENS